MPHHLLARKYIERPISVCLYVCRTVHVSNQKPMKINVELVEEV